MTETPHTQIQHIAEIIDGVWKANAELEPQRFVDAVIQIRAICEEPAAPRPPAPPDPLRQHPFSDPKRPPMLPKVQVKRGLVEIHEELERIESGLRHAHDDDTTNTLLDDLDDIAGVLWLHAQVAEPPSEAAIEAVRAPEDEDLDTTTTVTVGELKHWFCAYALQHPEQERTVDALADYLDAKIETRPAASED